MTTTKSERYDKDSLHVEWKHSGTEDGPLWYVCDDHGEIVGSGGWQYHADAIEEHRLLTKPRLLKHLSLESQSRILEHYAKADNIDLLTAYRYEVGRYNYGPSAGDLVQRDLVTLFEDLVRERMR